MTTSYQPRSIYSNSEVQPRRIFQDQFRRDAGQPFHGNSSPLRQSRSPPAHDLQVNQYSYNQPLRKSNNFKNENESELKKNVGPLDFRGEDSIKRDFNEHTNSKSPNQPPYLRNKSPPGQQQLHISQEKSFRRAPIDPIQITHRIEDLLREVETIKRERDHYQSEYNMERQKNNELEQEFYVLRGLIEQHTRPIGFEENLVLRNQYQNERELRIQAEAEVQRLRQQLGDALAQSHRDTLNLKKALTEMQRTNQNALQTIYEKGDQNIAQMEQLEDLAKIIREKEREIEEKDLDIQELTQKNRELHQTLLDVKQEAAALQQKKGADLLSKVQ